MKLQNKSAVIFLIVLFLVFSSSFVSAEDAIILEDTGVPPPSMPTPSFTPTFSPTPLTTLTPTPIIIADSGDPARVSTGPGEAAVLALVMSLIASLLYVGYSYTPAYRRNEAEKYAKEGAREGKNIDFKS